MLTNVLITFQNYRIGILLRVNYKIAFDYSKEGVEVTSSDLWSPWHVCTEGSGPHSSIGVVEGRLLHASSMSSS